MLAAAFNNMATVLSDQRSTYELHTMERERVVEERTAALHKSETELRALFAAMQDVVAVMDSDGRYLSGPLTGNRRLHTLLRLVIGKRLHDVFPATVADHALEKIHEALRNKTVVEYALRKLLLIKKCLNIPQAAAAAAPARQAVWMRPF